MNNEINTNKIERIKFKKSPIEKSHKKRNKWQKFGIILSLLNEFLTVYCFSKVFKIIIYEIIFKLK